VTSIEIFSTTLQHADRSRVVIPNRKIVGEILHNYGTMRQLSLAVGVAYSADLTQALGIVRDVVDQNPRVLKDPVAMIGVSVLADSAVTISILPWVKVDDYGPAPGEIYQALLERFRARRIEIPSRSAKCGCSMGVHTPWWRDCQTFRVLLRLHCEADPVHQERKAEGVALRPATIRPLLKLFS